MKSKSFFSMRHYASLFFTLLVSTSFFANSQQSNNYFIGLWHYNNGEDSLRIEQSGKDFLIIWKAKADEYQPHYISGKLENSTLVGDYYGHKNNVKVTYKEHFIYFTVKPFGAFAPIVNQQFKPIASVPVYVLPNEKELFSFRTFNEKRMSICIDKNNEYLIYRFGTNNHVELEYPQDKYRSFALFRYDYYLRGGGIENEGTDENRLSFINGNYKYIIYDDYYARGESSFFAIKIINLTTKKEFVLRAEPSSVKGTLIHLRDYEKLQVNELKSNFSLTEEILSDYMLQKTVMADGLHFGMKKSEVISFLGTPDENWDEGRNEALGEHFYNLKYTNAQVVIHFNDRKFQTAGEDFRICNIVLYGNSNIKTEKGIGIGSSAEEVMKVYKKEMEIGKATYRKNNFGDQNQKHIRLGDTEGLLFTFENDKVVSINLGVLQWN